MGHAVPQGAVCWIASDIRRSPIQITVRPAPVDIASARVLLQQAAASPQQTLARTSPSTFRAGLPRDLALFFQVRVYARHAEDRGGARGGTGMGGGGESGVRVEKHFKP
jgi:hypothetical protein